MTDTPEPILSNGRDTVSPGPAGPRAAYEVEREAADLEGPPRSAPRRSAQPSLDRDEDDGREPAPSGFDLGARFRALSSDAKLKVKRGLLIGAVAIGGYFMYSASHHGDAPKVAAVGANKLDMGAGLRGDSLETKLRGDFQDIKNSLKEQKDRLSAIESGKVPIAVAASGTPGATSAPGASGAEADAGADLPPAIPGAPSYPASPGSRSLASAASLPPSAPEAPVAPPPPPVEKVVGSIGNATMIQISAQGAGAAAGAGAAGKAGAGDVPQSSGSKKS